MRTIVSIVGGQTIQNVFFIEQLRKNGKKIDNYIFVTTKDMDKEGKTEHTIQACNIEDGKANKIVVNQNSVFDIKDELAKTIGFLKGEVYVNITGGTKLMSLATYDFFKQACPAMKAFIYYLPAGEKTCVLLHPNDGSCIAIDWKLDLSTYCKAHGLVIKNYEGLNKLTQKAKYTSSFFKEFISENINAAMLKIFMHQRYVTSQKTAREKRDLINIIKCLEKGNAISPNRKIKEGAVPYYVGGWFEEYIYNRIKLTLRLSDSEIWLGAEIVNGEKDAPKNEIDIMYIYNGRLNIVECKTSYSQKKGKFKSEFLYKIESNKKRFGLRCKSIYCHTDSLSAEDFRLEKSFRERAKLLQITVIDRDVLLDDIRFKEAIL
ncbi:MAG: Card1-like endonuclease domain-containing protein [Alkaliphilus sp.]